MITISIRQQLRWMIAVAVVTHRRRRRFRVGGRVGRQTWEWNVHYYSSFVEVLTTTADAAAAAAAAAVVVVADVVALW